MKNRGFLEILEQIRALTQIGLDVQIFALLSENYIQKKTFIR